MPSHSIEYPVTRQICGILLTSTRAVGILNTIYLALLISIRKEVVPVDSKYVQQFKKGSLEMILLCLIAKKETYGYEILTELNRNGAAVLGYAKEGTVYPILYRLQEAGLIQSRLAPAAANGGSKKYYALTDKGRQVLAELLAFWKRYMVCVNDFIRDCDLMEEET